MCPVTRDIVFICRFSLIILLNLMVTAQQINGRLVDLDTGSHIKIVPELVARCRTTCIEKFLPHSENMVAPANACRDTSQCSMCWDFCNFLYKEKSDVFKNICTNYTCLKGCKHACGYYNYVNWLSRFH